MTSAQLIHLTFLQDKRQVRLTDKNGKEQTVDIETGAPLSYLQDDTIALSGKSSQDMTNILDRFAKDYGMSAEALNEKLTDIALEYKISYASMSLHADGHVTFQANGKDVSLNLKANTETTTPKTADTQTDKITQLAQQYSYSRETMSDKINQLTSKYQVTLDAIHFEANKQATITQTNGNKVTVNLDTLAEVTSTTKPSDTKTSTQASTDSSSSSKVDFPMAKPKPFGETDDSDTDSSSQTTTSSSEAEATSEE